MNFKIKIEGMRCAHCENIIKESVKKIKGVKDIDINLKNKEAILYLKRNVINTVIKTINELGYKAYYLQ